MWLDPAIIAPFIIRFEPMGYIRATPWDHRATPPGMGRGNTRFASPIFKMGLQEIAASYGPACTSLDAASMTPSGHPRPVPNREADDRA